MPAGTALAVRTSTSNIENPATNAQNKKMKQTKISQKKIERE